MRLQKNEKLLIQQEHALTRIRQIYFLLTHALRFVPSNEERDALIGPVSGKALREDLNMCLMVTVSTATL